MGLRGGRSRPRHQWERYWVVLIPRQASVRPLAAVRILRILAVSIRSIVKG